jgi:SAM-dependent methyltransferase
VSEGFEPVAADWLTWARTPDHDAYWRCRDAFFELVPVPGRGTLEIGCGEGRVSRDLAERGHHVTGLELSPTLLSAAREAHPDGDYVLGRAEELPFEDCAFDLVVAYNSLMDVDDMPAAVREASRVLVCGGRLCACVTHPLADAGSFEDETFVVRGSYFGRRAVDVGVEHDGLRMRFTGWAYSLEAYARALEGSGFLIETLREPPAVREGSPWRRIPNFLMLRAVRR